jgi:hypothetical protein
MQRHFISWNRTTKETGGELIQAMALKGQNCYSKKRNTDQHHAPTGTEETKTVKNRDANGKFKTALVEMRESTQAPHAQHVTLPFHNP